VVDERNSALSTDLRGSRAQLTDAKASREKHASEVLSLRSNFEEQKARNLEMAQAMHIMQTGVESVCTGASRAEQAIVYWRAAFAARGAVAGVTAGALAKVLGPCISVEDFDLETFFKDIGCDPSTPKPMRYAKHQDVCKRCHASVGFSCAVSTRNGVAFHGGSPAKSSPMTTPGRRRGQSTQESPQSSPWRAGATVLLGSPGLDGMTRLPCAHEGKASTIKLPLTPLKKRHGSTPELKVFPRVLPLPPLRASLTWDTECDLELGVSATSEVTEAFRQGGDENGSSERILNKFDMALQSFVTLMIGRSDVRRAVFGYWFLCHIFYVTGIICSNVM